jgi:hypothetical protein
MVEQELEGLFEGGGDGSDFVDGPDEEAEKDRIEGVTGESEEGHY